MSVCESSMPLGNTSRFQRESPHREKPPNVPEYPVRLDPIPGMLPLLRPPVRPGDARASGSRSRRLRADGRPVHPCGEPAPDRPDRAEAGAQAHRSPSQARGPARRLTRIPPYHGSADPGTATGRRPIARTADFRPARRRSGENRRKSRRRKSY